MTSFLIALLLILIKLLGAYLVVDAFMLASSKDSSKERWCFKMKYVFAMASGFFFIFYSKNWLEIVPAIALALSMWPNTFYGLLRWLQEKHFNWYLWVLTKVNTVSRRRSV
jgi:hypothetical protein